MISVGKLGSASEAASYYAKDNYYTADQQQGGSAWAGKAAEALGLSGSVDAAAFERVLRGSLPMAPFSPPCGASIVAAGT